MTQQSDTPQSDTPQIPNGARWGKATQEAVHNFPISGWEMHPELLRAIVYIKRSAARANTHLGNPPAVTKEIANAIIAAANEVLEGEWDDQFPVDVFQTGSGTSTNMNVNEVLASLASERLGLPQSVHPNDHVNASQSSNDVIPSAIRIAVLREAGSQLLPSLALLDRTLMAKADQYATAVKPGRTHLVDATPVTFGQELSGYAHQIRVAADGVRNSLQALRDLPLGGTATGTGLNAPEGFAEEVISSISSDLELSLRQAPDHFAVQGGQDALATASGALRTCAIAMMKVANDLRLLASGPATGFGEISIPALQAGSSIMPGKVNPVLPEAVTQVAVHVFGNDAAVAFACSQGALELNAYLPVIAHNLLTSIDLLAAVGTTFAKNCIAGLEVDVARARRMAESSPAIATVLVPRLGYDAVAAIVKEAVAEAKTIHEVTLQRSDLTAAELDVLLDVDRMV